jgi:hypothetical protein
MTTPSQEPQPGTREHFLHIAQLQRWGTIQDYVDLCHAHGYFTPDSYATAIAHMERIHVRRRLKQVTNTHGWPVFGNIERIGSEGRRTRVFLQEELFGPEEYRQIVLTIPRETMQSPLSEFRSGTSSPIDNHLDRSHNRVTLTRQGQHARLNYRPVVLGCKHCSLSAAWCAVIGRKCLQLIIHSRFRS